MKTVLKGQTLLQLQGQVLAKAFGGASVMPASNKSAKKVNDELFKVLFVFVL